MRRCLSPCHTVFVIRTEPNYAQPWQMRPQRSATGSAFVVNTEKRKIITNAHVVCPCCGEVLGREMHVLGEQCHFSACEATWQSKEVESDGAVRGKEFRFGTADSGGGSVLAR